MKHDLIADDATRAMFCRTATEYYACGRFASFGALQPVGGNLLHHAIEMFLKGALAPRWSLAKLRKLSHDLPSIWAAFKEEFAVVDVGDLDETVAQLHEFEELRYPDNVLQFGMCIISSLEKPVPGSPAFEAGVPKTAYLLYLNQIDKLVAAIFKTADMNPKFFTGGLKDEVAKWLEHENPGGLTMK